jgi:hypothetical protein
LRFFATGNRFGQRCTGASPSSVWEGIFARVAVGATCVTDGKRERFADDNIVAATGDRVSGRNNDSWYVAIGNRNVETANHSPTVTVSRQPKPAFGPAQQLGQIGVGQELTAEEARLHQTREAAAIVLRWFAVSAAAWDGFPPAIARAG